MGHARGTVTSVGCAVSVVAAILLSVLPFGQPLVGLGFPVAAAAADDRPQALLVGDSVMHGMAQAYGANARTRLSARHSFILDTAPCRRVNTTGCRTGGARAPSSALDELGERAGQYSGAVVVAAGYNDATSDESFAGAVDDIVAEARRQRVVVLWLTYREQGGLASYYTRYNEILRARDADISELRVLDWNARSAGYPSSWFSSDGIHLRTEESIIAMADLIAEGLDQALGTASTRATPGQIPTAPSASVPIGHVSPLRCYGDKWVGINQPDTPAAPLMADYWGGIHVLDVPVRILDTRDMAGKIGPHRVLPVPVAGKFGVPADATGVVLTVTSVEPCASGFVSVFPCGAGVPTSAVLNANAETIVSSSAVVMLGGGWLCVFNNEPTDVVIDLAAWIGVGGAGTEFTHPLRLVDTRPGEREGIAVPQQRVRARTGLTVDVSSDPQFGPETEALTVNLTAVDPAAAGFLTALPGPCAAYSAPPTTASVTVAAHQNVASATTVGLRDRAFCIYTSVDVDVVIDLQGVHGYFPHLVWPINPQRIVDTRISGPVPAHTGIDLDAVLATAPDFSTGVIVNIAGVDPTRAGYVVVYSCNVPDAPFVSNLNVTAGTTVSNRALISLELGRSLCVYSNVPVHLVIDVEAWVP